MSKSAGYLGVVFALAGLVLPIAAAPPQITQIDPLALEPGNTVELTFRGQNLKDPRSLWT